MILFTLVAAALIGAGIGALCGLVAGIVLALRRASVVRDRAKARRVAFLASATPLGIYAAFLATVAVSSAPSFWFVSGLYLLAALFAGAAGAFLSPWVVHGRSGRAPSLHE